MSTGTAQPSLHDVGYRRLILVLGACWGAAPALGLVFGDLPTEQWLLAIGTVVTISLGVTYELDTRQIRRYGEGVPLAWSYALVAPISVVLWELLGPGLAQVPGLALLGIVAGPPASALVYLWQRGRAASIG